MNLTPPLTEAQRSELQETVEWLAKIGRQFAAVKKKQIDLEAVKTKALGRLAAAESAADAGDEDASAKVLALRDQVSRLNLNLRRAELEYNEIMETAKKAVRTAKEEIRVAHRPLVKQLTDHLTDNLAPYFTHLHHARNLAEQVQAVGDLLHFARPLPYHPLQDRTFASPEEALSVLRALSETVTALLENQPVLTMPEQGSVGGLSFPAFTS